MKTRINIIRVGTQRLDVCDECLHDIEGYIEEGLHDTTDEMNKVIEEVVDVPHFTEL